MLIVVNGSAESHGEPGDEPHQEQYRPHSSNRQKRNEPHTRGEDNDKITQARGAWDQSENSVSRKRRSHKLLGRPCHRDSAGNLICD